MSDEKKKPESKKPQVAASVDAREIMRRALADRKMLEEIWRKSQEKENE